MQMFTQKEKRIVILIGIIVSLSLYLRFFLLGQINHIKALQAEIVSLTSSEQLYEIAKIKKSNFETTLTKLTDTLKNIRNKYPAELRDEDIITTLDSVSAATNVKITAYRFIDPKSVDPTRNQTAGKDKVENPITDKNLLGLMSMMGLIDAANGIVVDAAKNQEAIAAVNASASSQDSSGEIKQVTASVQEESKKSEADRIRPGESYLKEINLAIEGEYEQIKKFVKEIENLNNKAVVNKMNITKEQNDKLKTTISIYFYGIKDKINALKNKSVDQGDVKATDVFSKLSGTVITQSNPSAVGGPTGLNPTQGLGGMNGTGDATLGDAFYKYDFAARLLPFGFGMSPQTLTISARTAVNTSLGLRPIVTSDNPGLETAEIAVETVAGKYYSTMKAGKDVYPTVSSKKQEFVPRGQEINLLIDSTRRMHLYDTSKVEFILHNKTNLVFRVTIQDDDKEKPRVKITKKTENIVVEERRK